MEIRKYQQFRTVSEMDEFIHNVLTELDLKEGERALLRLLAGHSCKVAGVSWLKVQTMADKLGTTYKTVQRYLKRLGSLGVIKRVEQFKPVRGGNTSSLTLLCPTALSYRTSEETATASKPESASLGEETFSFKTKSLKDLNIRKQELDLSYLEGSGVAKEFIQAVKPFTDSATEVAGLWERVESAQRRFYTGEPVEVAVRAFKQTVLASKLGKIKKEFNAYFYGVLSQMFAVEQRQENKGKVFDWLNSELVY